MAEKVSASILVSYSPDGGNRDISWGWVRKRWEAFFPDYPIYIGGVTGINGFQQTASANKAASQSNSDVYVFTDCDTTTDPEWIREAVNQIGTEKIPWALYKHCHKLDRESSASILQSDPGRTFPSYVAEEEYETSVGGTLIVPRRGFEEVGGYDERFTVWGAYDSSFALAMDTLWGERVRFDSTIYHLWHPTPTIQELFGHPAQSQQQALAERYRQASMNKKAMREVRFG